MRTSLGGTGFSVSNESAVNFVDVDPEKHHEPVLRFDGVADATARLGVRPQSVISDRFQVACEFDHGRKQFAMPCAIREYEKLETENPIGGVSRYSQSLTEPSKFDADGL